MELKTGIRGNIQKKVTDSLSALALKSGQYNILGTPAVAALVEETAWRSVEEYIDVTKSTVGTKLDISHIAPTPVGMDIRCETVLKEIDQRRLVFEFQVFDEKEKISEGTHERFIVDNDKFVAKAYKKL